MRKITVTTILTLVMFVFFVQLFTGCNNDDETSEVSKSGIKEASANINTGSDGLTTEQRNISKRLSEDNKPGAIKYLYVVSAYSGDALFATTVDGKITSSTKRLTNAVKLKKGDRGEFNGDFIVPRIQDDGTHGSSVPYVYGWDTGGNYFQFYISGGTFTIVSDKPLRFPKVVINNIIEFESSK